MNKQTKNADLIKRLFTYKATREFHFTVILIKLLAIFVALILVWHTINEVVDLFKYVEITLFETNGTWNKTTRMVIPLEIYKRDNSMNETKTTVNKTVELRDER